MTGTITVTDRYGYRTVKTESDLKLNRFTMADYMAFHINNGARIVRFDTANQVYELAYDA